MGDRHAPFAALALLAEARVHGGAGDPETQAWVGHVESCDSCRERMREIEEVLGSFKAGDAGDAPRSWIERAERLSAARGRLGSLRGDFSTRVVYDSAVQLGAGARSGLAETRQLVFASDRLEIEISLAPETAEESWPLTGQVFALEGSEDVELGGCRVVLIENGQERDQAQSSAAGDFLLAVRPRGPFQIRIEGAEWSITTPLLDP